MLHLINAIKGKDTKSEKCIQLITKSDSFDHFKCLVDKHLGGKDIEIDQVTALDDVDRVVYYDKTEGNAYAVTVTKECSECGEIEREVILVIADSIKEVIDNFELGNYLGILDIDIRLTDVKFVK